MKSPFWSIKLKSGTLEPSNKDIFYDENSTWDNNCIGVPGEIILVPTRLYRYK